MEKITEYNHFSKKMSENLYFYNTEYKNHILKNEYEMFIKEIENGKKMAKDALKKYFGYESSKLDTLYDNNNERMNNIILRTFDSFLERYSNKRIDNDGYCLLSNLIGKVVYMNNNKDMLGVINSIDENYPRFIIVDFAEENLVKVDIDELYISGQKTN